MIFASPAHESTGTDRIAIHVISFKYACCNALSCQCCNSSPRQDRAHQVRCLFVVRVAPGHFESGARLPKCTQFSSNGMGCLTILRQVSMNKVFKCALVGMLL